MLKASWKIGSETPTFKCWYLYQTVKCQIIATNGWLSFHRRNHRYREILLVGVTQPQSLERTFSV